MSKTHWRRLVNVDYLGSYALDGENDLILTIDFVRQEQVTGNNGKKEQCIVAHFKERDVKPMILNRTNCKTITKVVGTPYLEDWSGHQIAIYVDTTRLAGEVVECLRIRQYEPKNRQSAASNAEFVCEQCGKKITAAFGMGPSAIAENTKKRYGRMLCSECATAEKGKQ